MKTKNSSKSTAASVPVKMEYAGHIIEGNIWLKLGLSKQEAALLKSIAGHIFEKEVASGKTARFLLQAALAHFDMLFPLMIQDQNYACEEGFLNTDTYLQGVIVQQRARIASLKGGAK